MIALALVVALLWITAAFLWLADGSSTTMAATIALADTEPVVRTTLVEDEHDELVARAA